MTHIPAIVALTLALTPALQPKEPPKHEQPAHQPSKQGEPAGKTGNPAATPEERPDDYCKQRHERFNARAKQGHEKGDIDLIFIGDSITEQWEGPGKQVWEKYYGKRHAVNCGTGGDRTQHVIWRLQHGNVDGLDNPAPADAKPPHLAVIMIGTNNMGPSDTPEQITEGVQKVVSTLQEKLPHTQVLLLAIFPRGEKPEDPLRQKVARTNELIKAVHWPDSVHYLDIGSNFVQKDGTISNKIMPDYLHLTPEGYEIWAKAIEPKVHELMGEK